MSQGSISTPDLVGLVSRQFTPDLIHSTAQQLGEDDEHTRSALSTSIPSVLTAFSDVAGSDSGAAHLAHVIDDSRRGAGGVAASFGSPAGRVQGAALFDREAGDRAGPIAEAVARSSGVKPESARKLLGGATGAALAALGGGAGRLEPDVLKTMLAEQRGEFVRRLPGPIASLFGAGRPAVQRGATGYREDVVDHGRVMTGPAIRRVPGPSRRGWVAPVLALCAVLLAIPLLRGMRRSARLATERTRAAAEQVMPHVESVPLSLPNGQTVTVGKGSAAYGMANFLAGSGDTPARFTITPMNFGFGSTTLTPESSTSVNEIAAILAAYPTAAIRLESYTDNVGTPESNLGLSLSRSESVKSVLVSKGIDASRIATAGLGQENPVASNDTESGRALNRRTDVVVTSR